ncbi:nicotine dehydrogenase subunit alpha NdhA [Phyllobacterium sp. 22229]|uniref:Nicotine dehydrogenase subunit alpha NdhA n=1 Tax=Agrobacterium radiobacter TaxID=362 RepID=A0ABD5LMY6_AGRRD
MSVSVNRRAFLLGTGALAGAVIFPITRSGAQPSSTPKAEGVEILSWIVINPDNTVTYTIPQTEVGQGVTTTIPQMLAEELDSDWEKTTVAFYDPAISKARGTPYVWTTTLGSLSAHYLFAPSRLAAAQVRAMLVEAAAERLSVPAEELTTGGNQVHHGKSGRALSYADVAAAAVKLTPPPAEKVVYRSVDERRFIGKPIAPRSTVPATRGEIAYGIDVDLPSMRYAAVQQSPVFGGKLVRIKDEALKGLPGHPEIVKIKAGFVGYNSPVPDGEDPDLWAAAVNIDDTVAVVADSWWEAKSALELLEIEWDSGPHATLTSDKLKSSLSKQASGELPVLVETGDVTKRIKEATRSLTAEYVFPFMDPAPLEPLNCTVLIEKTKATVWAGSQYADDAHRITTELTGAAPENVKFNLMQCGGGFGRRVQNDFVYQAVQIGKAMLGTPVKVLWTREECIKRSTYTPLTVVKFAGALDKDGNIDTWSCRIASAQAALQSYGGTHFPFFFPNMEIAYQRDQTTPIPFGWMRGVGLTQHLWMNFGFLNELAVLADKDSVDLYRALLEPALIPKNLEHYDIAVARSKTLRRVLDAAAEQAGWGERAKNGSGRGIAVSDTAYYLGYESSSKAAVVDVTIKDASVRVDKVAITIDAGTIINPDIVRQQLEGCISYALTNAFYSEITVEDGQVQQNNFYDYPILRIGQVPEIEINLLPSDGSPQSVGEDAVPITIAALVNAIADAGGPRIRSLPIKELTLV